MSLIRHSRRFSPTLGALLTRWGEQGRGRGLGRVGSQTMVRFFGGIGPIVLVRLGDVQFLSEGIQGDDRYFTRIGHALRLFHHLGPLQPRRESLLRGLAEAF
jgi:hypothetical protein